VSWTQGRGSRSKDREPRTKNREPKGAERRRLGESSSGAGSQGLTRSRALAGKVTLSAKSHRNQEPGAGNRGSALRRVGSEANAQLARPKKTGGGARAVANLRAV
jgi:hypothetical protein